MENCKPAHVPIVKGIKLSEGMSAKTPEEKEKNEQCSILIRIRLFNVCHAIYKT